MEEIMALVVWFLVEVVLVRTGRALVWLVSLGRWRGEAAHEREGRLYGPAGALSFRREGQRVLTINGLFFAGLAFYVTFVLALVVYVAKA